MRIYRGKHKQGTAHCAYSKDYNKRSDGYNNIRLEIDTSHFIIRTVFTSFYYIARYVTLFEYIKNFH